MHFYLDRANGNKQLTGVTSPGSISRSHTYDAKGRVQIITETVDANSFPTAFAYANPGRLDTRIIRTKHADPCSLGYAPMFVWANADMASVFSGSGSVNL